MTSSSETSRPLQLNRLARFAPGLPALLGYRREDLSHDVMAGLSVAGVALPVGVALAQLAGFSPVVGLYASILPLVAYAIFGTSRQLIVGPDAATCALVAAIVTPLAAGKPDVYLSLTVVLTFLAGLICIGASFLKLGALADLLSKPILVGFLNGIALFILTGQLGHIFGFALEKQGILPKLFELATKIGQTHWPTLAVGVGSFAVLLLAERLLPRLPAALVTLVVAGAAVALFGLDTHGIATVGAVPAGLPEFRIPSVPLHMLDSLIAAAAGLALVSFASMMLTARGFADKNHYDIDVDREFAALGAAQIAAALSQSFAVSGADSRTAMNDAAGGRTQAAGLVAAAAILMVLLFLTGPLSVVPIAALAAVLIRASLSLINVPALREFYRLDRGELALSLLASVGVIWVGAIKAVLVAVILALLRFVHAMARPKVEVLGEIDGLPGFYAVASHPQARTEPGLVLFRFNAPLVFFNCPYFKRKAQAAITAASPGLRWFVLDGVPVSRLDITGYQELRSLATSLRALGAEFVISGRATDMERPRQAKGIDARRLALHTFHTLGQALVSYRAMRAAAAPSAEAEPPAPGPATDDLRS